MNFIKRFIEEVSSDMAIEEYAQRNPARMRRFIREVRRTGYPTPQSEAEDILFNRLSAIYGIPRDINLAERKLAYKS
ncbi:MAG TPA: hypothetical protein ACFYEL_10155 [Candidatus Wunengus californicus]|uniref:hypothetical protein n=1 Tax=Candidatus Wunengus californicus TaxID=3367619 RepID=UPI004028FD66